MTFRNDDDFTRNLNDRIKELEDMTNEIENKRQELDDQATAADDATTELDDQAVRAEEEAANAEEEAANAEEEAANTAKDSRVEGDTIFFSANIDSSQPLKLNVTNNNGDLEIYGTDTNSVEIMATRQSGEEVDHSHWFFQQVDNEITLRPNWQVGSHVGDIASKIKTQLKQGFKSSEWSSKDFKFGLDVNYDLVVRVPKQLAEGSRVTLKTANGDGQSRDVAATVDFKTANGDVSVQNTGGDLTISSANGDLSAKGITGNANASTANGDVSLEGVTGSVEANTANGDVHVNGATGWIAIRTANGDARAENVTMKGGRFVTVAGDIQFDGVLNNATSYAFDTVSGEVVVKARVPASGATLSAKSVTGDANATGEWTKQGKRDWLIGEGNGPKISAKSVSSDIHVHAVVDQELTLIEEDPAAVQAEREAESGVAARKDNEVNVNLDLEIERAKGWLKDLGSKLGTILEGEPARKPEAPEQPVAPVAPEAPKAPASPEQVSATAERRTKLLEAVKNGDMTIDEALAELERDA